jgi:ATP-dependent Lhr-like helicase
MPRWNGGRMPLSNTLADAMVQLALAEAERPTTAPELQCVRPLLDMQQAWSALPTPETLLAETLQAAKAGTCFCTRLPAGMCTSAWPA